MSKDNVWSDLHKSYTKQHWIDKPSIFAEQTIEYFPKQGKLLELGAGQGQDSRFFAEHRYAITSTDIEESALELAKSKVPARLESQITFQKVDLSEKLPFEDSSFDVVYAHLSLHYFDYQTTVHLFQEINRVLTVGGVFAFLVNSINDPEYGTGEKLEEDYFQIDKTAKRYFSLDRTRDFTKHFQTILLDDQGETYKDREKNVHNLIRYIGRKK
jgi:ubiquinone/menaquinone biosynthesis C-methylase UbiE